MSTTLSETFGRLCRCLVIGEQTLFNALTARESWEGRAMGVADDIICNSHLFGSHKGERHQTQSLGSILPGSNYEITPSGRLELLECTYEDRSDPSRKGIARLFGAMTPVFTGPRRDTDYHGFVDLWPLGRAKFTDGTLVAFEPEVNGSAEPGLASNEIAQALQLNSTGSNLELQCSMTVVINDSRRREPKVIPFLDQLERAGRILDHASQQEWIDDAESRLRDLLSRINPGPTILRYSLVRIDDGLILYTVTANEVGRREVGLLSAGEWPCWGESVEAVPEFDRTQVVFDAVSRHEWARRWDMGLQQHRMQAEHGIFA